MAQNISSLTLGSLVSVKENDEYVSYQVAGIAVHGVNTVTLVRKYAASLLSVFGASAYSLYNGSTLDTTMQNFENRYNSLHSAELNTVEIIYGDESSSPVAINRKVFALSYTEAGFGANGGLSENAALPCFNSDLSRIKTYYQGGDPTLWWLRSVYPSSVYRQAFYVRSEGNSNITSKTYQLAVVPAHVVDGDLKVSDNADPVTGEYTIYYPAAPGKPTLLSPVNIYVPSSSDISFSWIHDNTDVGWPQSGADLEYSYEGGAWTTLATISDASQTYVLSAGTLPLGDLRWRVRTYANGVAGDWSDPAAFSTAEVLPDAPTLLSPINEYVEIDDDIVFEWQHNIDTGTPQTAADLQYSYEGGAWTTLATIEDASQTYTCPADTLAAGSYQWRARTYNSDDAEGEWSDPVSFIGIGAPLAPGISGVTASSRPTISWQAVGQTGYQLQLMQSGAVLLDTGETAGADKTYTLPFYLANGSYTVRIRVLNASLTWSAWAELPFVLAVTAPSVPTLSVEPITDGARITVLDIDASTAHVYLLRDGVPVADITGQYQYDDYAAIGSTEYVVRTVDDNENYADSAGAVITVAVSGAALAAVDDLSSIVRLKQKSAGQPAVTRQKQLIGSAFHYAGREHPVFAFSEFSEESFSPAYYYTSLIDWAELEALVDERQTVLYRDTLGNKYYGVVTTNNANQDFDRVSFVLSMRRVDYVEEIDYAEVEV